MTYNQYFGRWLTRFLVVASAIILVLGLSSGNAGAHVQRDCDNNAVIRCGIDHHNNVNDIEELKQKYRENQQGNVHTVFAAFGMPNEAAFNGMVQGVVTGSNQVYVDNKLVATDALTAGRQRIDNQRGTSQDMGNGFWQRPPSVSFASPSGGLASLVKLDQNGVFQYAVILSCGNPVKAKPVTQKPKEQPKQPNFEVIKDVSPKSKAQWQQQVTAESGDEVEFRITVRNTGETDLEDVVVRDTLQTGLTYVDNSLTVAGTTSGDLFGSGLNIGTVKQGQERLLHFRVTVESSEEDCVLLRNKVFVKPKDQEEKRDSAVVKICKEKVVTTQPQQQQQQQQVQTVVTRTEAAPPTAKVLPVTGVRDLLGIFTATTIAGSLAYHYATARRLRR
jgi:uncharacterized repeat protein (TIGR01451 family)